MAVGIFGTGFMAQAVIIFRFVMILFFVAIGLGIAAYYVLVIKKYDIKVLVLSKRYGGTLKLFQDKGGYFKDKNGALLFKLFKTRKVIPPPKYEYLLPAQRGNAILFYQIGEDEYLPLNIEDINLDTHGIQLKPEYADIRLWASQTLKDLKDRYSAADWMEAYGNYVVFGMTAILCIILIYITIQYASDVVPALNAAASAARSVPAPY